MHSNDIVLLFNNFSDVQTSKLTQYGESSFFEKDNILMFYLNDKFAAFKYY